MNIVSLCINSETSQNFCRENYKYLKRNYLSLAIHLVGIPSAFSLIIH